MVICKEKSELNGLTWLGTKDRLLKTLFDGPTRRKLFPDRSREQIFTRLLDRYVENIIRPA